MEVYKGEWTAEGEVMAVQSKHVLIRFKDPVTSAARADWFSNETWVRDMDLDDKHAIRFRETLSCEC